MSGTEASVIYCFSVRHRSIAIRQVGCNRYQRSVLNWDKPVSFSCIAIAPTMTPNQRWRSLSHSTAWEPHEGRFQSLAIENNRTHGIKKSLGWCRHLWYNYRLSTADRKRGQKLGIYFLFILARCLNYVG